MKRKILFVSCLILGIGQLNAQTDTSLLNVNNIEARVNPAGLLFNNNQMSTPGFKIKNTGGASTIYSSGLWIGALDGSDSLHIAGVMYGIDNDFFGGPISVDYSDSLDWKKTWVISKSEIDEFNDFFACQSNPLCDESSVFPNYVIPNVISSWPAHGDISQNEDFYIAPFIDLNLDGFYNPADGDYPCIKGDQMIFSIFNDFASTHTETKGRKLGVQVRQIVFSFNDTGVIGNTVFVENQIVNKSQANYHDLYIGQFTDFDLGCSDDDFVGCDSNLNLFFGYNGDMNDDSSSCLTNRENFGLTPPAQGVKILNHSMNSFGYFNRPGFGIAAQQEPDIAEDYYQFMIGKWKDGSSFKLGGSGHVSDSNTLNINTKFMFPSDPETDTIWSEISSNNPAGDRKGVGSVGPFNLNFGEEINFNLAFIYARDTNHVDSVAHVKSVTKLKAASVFVQNYYDNLAQTCPFSNGEGNSSSLKEISKGFDLEVFPNPSSTGVFNLRLEPTTEEQLYLSVIAIDGRDVLSKTINDKTLQLDLASFSKGAYQLIISNKTHIIASKKLFVN